MYKGIDRLSGRFGALWEGRQCKEFEEGVELYQLALDRLEGKKDKRSKEGKETEKKEDKKMKTGNEEKGKRKHSSSWLGEMGFMASPRFGRIVRHLKAFASNSHRIQVHMSPRACEAGIFDVRFMSQDLCVTTGILYAVLGVRYGSQSYNSTLSSGELVPMPEKMNMKRGPSKPTGYSLTAGEDRMVWFWDLSAAERSSTVSGLHLEADRPHYR
ncbi:uncharacterized protein MELLADRAFT_107522 [Melampsora larici-populina 98AG31]|uniref:Uncharacterized protein n=1 Tax=Melampsora larici-populina (strain 98AG31 / pathotype 3-4-7) TaxID=747676 RepID=F4RQJ4_MELLP|nr:uncharacterized protein MELLADRAFT_107522 [Melampsora larici-populina 98AG31]EGG05309.1 hypothetical protein MELLADRAFT_107522 [Melampsora larici-populina 98AG31]